LQPAFRQFLAASSTRILSTLINALTAIFLARLLLPENYGLFTLVFTTITVVNTFADVGLSTAIVKYAAETEKDADIVWTGFIIDATVTFAVFVFSLLLAGALESLMGRPVRNLLIIFSLFLVPCCFDTFLSRLQARRRIELLSALRLTEASLEGLFSVSLVLLGYGVPGALIGYIAAKTLTTIIAIGYAGVRGNFKWGLGKSLLYLGFFIYLSNLSLFFITRADRVVLAFFRVSNEAIGWYSAAQGLADLMILIPVAFRIVAMPIVSRAHIENDFEKNRKIFEASIYGCGFYVVTVTIPLLVFSSSIIHLVYGSSYAPAVQVLQVGVFASIFFSISTVLLTFFYGTGRAEAVARIGVTQMLCFILLLSVFINIFGYIGAAIADDLTQAIGVFLLFWEIKRTLGFKIHFSLEAIRNFFKLLLEQTGLKTSGKL